MRFYSTQTKPNPAVSYETENDKNAIRNSIGTYNMIKFVQFYLLI